MRARVSVCVHFLLIFLSFSALKICDVGTKSSQEKRSKRYTEKSIFFYECLSMLGGL